MNNVNNNSYQEIKRLFLNLSNAVDSLESVSIEPSEELFQCMKYSEAPTNDNEYCSGLEPLPQFSLNSIRWSCSNSTNLNKIIEQGQTLDEYSCLVEYYCDVYGFLLKRDDDMIEYNEITVKNTIKRFDRIQILGYKYYSTEANRNKNTYFCAYHYNDNGVLELRPGQIQFFFQHTQEVESVEEDEENGLLDHMFAFVRWFKYPNPGTEDLSSYNGNNVSCWQNKFEDMSQDCILPVHKLYSGIHMKMEYLTNINIVLFLPRKVF